jgi:hypothetical protein
MLSKTDLTKVFETLLSIPGLNESSKAKAVDACK